MEAAGYRSGVQRTLICGRWIDTINKERKMHTVKKVSWDSHSLLAAYRKPRRKYR